MTTTMLNLFATTPKGVELLLVEELRALGAVNPAEKLAGVSFQGDLAVAYKACLWSRLANRILLLLGKFPAATPEALYAGVQTIAWDEHIDPEGSLAVHFVSSQSEINHTLFGAQKVKDAIVDQLRDKYNTRPTVVRDQPQVSVYVYLYKNEAAISIDLSGESLHKRGYRLSSVDAPLKENLAAAVLLRAKWPAVAQQGGALLDPMCGSGTLLIEGALMAGDIAPGLGRDYYGFLGWRQHQPVLWQRLVAEAEKRKETGMKAIPTIIGYDQDPYAVKVAFENIERASMRGVIHVEKQPLSVFEPRASLTTGLVVTNPPYGERLGEAEELQPLYTLLGERLKQHFSGWQAAVLTSNPELGKQMGLRAAHYYALFNGALPCKLLIFDVASHYFVDRSPGGENDRRIRAATKAVQGLDRTAVDMFINRLHKNLKQMKRKQNQSESYCVYDADLPDYAFVIHLSEEGAHVQEYAAPKSIDPQKVLRRRQEMLAVLPEILELPPAKIFFTQLLTRKSGK